MSERVDLITAEVNLGRSTVTVYVHQETDAQRLAKMLAPGGRVSIEQVFGAPGDASAPGEEVSSFSIENEEPAPRRGGARKSRKERTSDVGTTGGVCRGVSLLPDAEHGPPGRGQALGFCTNCAKAIPRAVRLEAFQKAKKSGEEGENDSRSSNGSSESSAS